MKKRLEARHTACWL